MRKRWMRVGIVVAVFLVTLIGPAAEAEVESCTRMTLSAVRGLAETYAEGLIRTMVVLATTAPVRAASWDGMDGLLAAFEEASLPMATWFALPDGSYYTVDGGLASANLSDRDYFPRVLSGRISAGSVVISRSTGRASTVIAVPVSDHGQVVGVLGVSVFLDTWSQAIGEELDLPEGTVFYAAASDGRLALHSEPSRLLASVSAAGTVPGETVETTSELFGWVFGVGTEE